VSHFGKKYVPAKKISLKSDVFFDAKITIKFISFHHAFTTFSP